MLCLVVWPQASYRGICLSSFIHINSIWKKQCSIIWSHIVHKCRIRLVWMSSTLYVFLGKGKWEFMNLGWTLVLYRSSSTYICCISVLDVVTKPLLLAPYHLASNTLCSSTADLEQSENVGGSPNFDVHLLLLRVISVVTNLFLREKDSCCLWQKKFHSTAHRCTSVFPQSIFSY